MVHLYMVSSQSSSDEGTRKLTAEMNGYIILTVALAVIAAGAQKQEIPEITVVGEETLSIADINKDLLVDDIKTLRNTERSSINSETLLWNSPVPYVLENNLDLNAKGVILKAFDQFRLKSCIDFKPRESEDYYITVQKLSGCWSYIGRSKQNGQELSIGQYCDQLGIVEHEFLHALGFYHEQSRYDRDNYVTIHLENVIKGYENNFLKVTADVSTTHGTSYDYWSVMHYGKNDFTNGNGSTITTNDPAYQDVIGQRYEVSATDIKELNLLYKCNSTVAFHMHCSFSNGTMCEMSKCSRASNGWEIVSQATGGPSFDHTSLNATMQSVGPSYFMHVSTASGQQGDSAWLETKRMTPNRKCHVQCLQFYYFHSGSVSDQLNIWIREFQNENDFTGQHRLVGQITGRTTAYWQLHHVSLNATKSFQVEFEVQKGAGNSTGGISIDDINLSELECPHVTLQINDFDKLLNTGGIIYTPPQRSKEGYVYRFGAIVYSTGSEGVFVQMLSGDYDNQLEWPVPRRQVILQFVDQNPDIQLQMSNQVIFTSGTSYWDNPRKTGNSFVDENNKTVYYGPLIGYVYTRQYVNYRDIFKANSAIFTFSFQDLTPVVNGSTLPCPEPQPAVITYPPTDQDQGPCSSRISTTTNATPTSNASRTTTDAPVETTLKTLPTTLKTTTPSTSTSTTPVKTTPETNEPTTEATTNINTPKTTHGTTSTTTDTLVKTCDKSIFGFSPALMSSVFLTFLSVLLLLVP